MEQIINNMNKMNISHTSNHDEISTYIRSEADAHFQGKHKFDFTQPCNNVLRKDKTSGYGICTRDLCTFAHSLAELRIACCNFGATCYKRATTCQYIHPHETNFSFYRRTGKIAYDLPETSEHSRQRKQVQVQSPIREDCKFVINIDEDSECQSIKLISSDAKPVSSVEPVDLVSIKVSRAMLEKMKQLGIEFLE